MAKSTKKPEAKAVKAKPAKPAKPAKSAKAKAAPKAKAKVEAKGRKCSVCKKYNTGHNARTCKG